MASQMETWWRNQNDLDDDQRDVIRLPADGSYLIKGPPGSGKTNLLLLRANYLKMTEHPNLAVIVFNRTLRDYIRAGATRYSFDAEQVYTARQFFESLLDEAHQNYEREGTFDDIRRAQLTALNEIIGNQKAPIYDTILLDEAQDFLADEISVFRSLCRDLFMVADSRQQIYPGVTNLEFLKSQVGEQRDLTFHYRNGLPICRLADNIGQTFTLGYDLITPTCNYNSPDLEPSVESFRGNFSAQCHEILRRLKLQRRAYPEGMLGVICPRLNEVQSLGRYLRESELGDLVCIQNREDGYQQIDDEKPIWLSTIHSAKGLEFRALHFAAAEFVSRFAGEQKRLVYTAVTRAKTSLVVYHDRSLPPYFDAAFNFLRSNCSVNTDIGIAFGTD